MLWSKERKWRTALLLGKSRPCPRAHAICPLKRKIKRRKSTYAKRHSTKRYQACKAKQNRCRELDSFGIRFFVVALVTLCNKKAVTLCNNRPSFHHHHLIIIITIIVDDNTWRSNYWVYLSSNHPFQVYYKGWQVLLQLWQPILLQSATAFLLQSATSVITKCDSYYKVWQFYYKVRRLLRSATILEYFFFVCLDCLYY